MTPLPGVHLTHAWDTLSAAQKDGIRKQLEGYLRIMRRARSPSRICSLSGGPIFSPRVPLNIIGPYDTEEEFHRRRRLLEVASPIGFSGPSYEDTLALAGSMRHDHETVFTHGDLMHWNILVHNGRISGIIDWETAGWLPDYWEYATMLRTDLRGHW
ncbi:hypothetical protein PLICRDRAFT_178495 [Plicaturopsis crispa FD-325 SS-3]|nr:hypothetical protein PLICRDRAFT_178495 [Plicaturopsis crispa FD-325 SS-3]